MIAWTGLFLLVAGIIVLRLRRSFAIADQVSVLQLSIDSLLAERAEQQNAIGPLMGEQLRVRAEALGMRVASDSELVVLTLPPVR
ncbi:MAG: hypothetical protein H0W15_12985 [Gemmatimonadales bacterium]|nr:hypothetical protein [Gemmatimonadales bacterium]